MPGPDDNDVKSFDECENTGLFYSDADDLIGRLYMPHCLVGARHERRAWGAYGGHHKLHYSQMNALLGSNMCAR